MTDQAQPNWKPCVYYGFAGLVALQAGLVMIPLGILAAMALENALLLSLAAVLMLGGCIGAFANLDGSRHRQRDKRNMLLLIAGLVGTILMLAVDERFLRGGHVLGHWFLFAFPMVHAAVHVALCALRLKRNPGEYLLKPWQITAQA